MSKEIEVVFDKPNQGGGANNAHSHEVAMREPNQIVHAQERTAAEIVARLDKIKEVQKEAMESGIDYGVIPGTERKDKDGKDISKPTLLKAGAEKLCVLFNLDAQFQGDGNSEQIITETHPDGKTIRHLIVKRYCTIYSQVSGARLGGASSMCTTLETKYAYRKGARLCPECGKPTLIHTKRDQVNWWCNKYNDGCGVNFEVTDPRIKDQQVGRIVNEDIADLFNTVIRMSEKRSLVAAVRLVTGASAIFDEEAPETEGADIGRQDASDEKGTTGARTEPKKAATGTAAQGNDTSKATDGASGNPTGDKSDTPPKSSAPSDSSSKIKATPKVGKVSDEQAKELTEIFDKIPLKEGVTRDQSMQRILWLVGLPKDNKGTLGDVPAPNFKVVKQMLEKQFENSQGASV